MHLNRLLEHYRRQEEPDGAGGGITDWVHLGSIRARVSQATTAERVAAQQAGSEHTQPVYVRPRADVRRGDELRGPEGSWRVTAVYRPSEPVYRRCDCELVQGEENHG
nr:phage head closure protein [Spiractinospora alimapuensis]